MLTEKAFKESGLDSPSLSPPLPQYKRDQFTHKTGNDSQNNLTPISKWLSQIQMGNDVSTILSMPCVPSSKKTVEDK